jgi:SH3-like domain-containing protein
VVKLFVSGLLAATVATIVAVPMISSDVSAQQTNSVAPITRGPSGLPLPRFVSIKAERVNMRIGPGTDYAVDWMYQKKGLPLEIVQEYDNWRRVRDSEGAEGWIYQSLLSGKRTAIASPWNKGKSQLMDLQDGPSEESETIAQVQPGAIGTISSCNGNWCEISFGSAEGWMKQTLLWGAYPGKRIND